MGDLHHQLGEVDEEGDDLGKVEMARDGPPAFRHVSLHLLDYSCIFYTCISGGHKTDNLIQLIIN